MFTKRMYKSLSQQATLLLLAMLLALTLLFVFTSTSYASELGGRNHESCATACTIWPGTYDGGG